MGYTHYWSTEASEISNEALEQVEETLRIYSDIVQLEFNNSSPPIVEKDEIIFNGIGNDGHETFYFEEGSDFCKTNRKPYDIVVCEVLLILKHYFGNEMNVSSDGFWVSKEGIAREELDGNWNKALDNVRERFGLEFELLPIIDGGYYCFDVQPK